MIEPIKPKAKNYIKEETVYVISNNTDISNSVIDHIYDLSKEFFNVKIQSEGNEIYIIAYIYDHEKYDIALKQYEKDLELYKNYLVKSEEYKRETLARELLQKSIRYNQYLKLKLEFEGK